MYTDCRNTVGGGSDMPCVARLGGRIGNSIVLYDLIDSERVGRTYWLKVGLIELTALRPTHDATHKAVAPNVNSFSRSTAGWTSLWYKNLSRFRSASVLGSKFPS